MRASIIIPTFNHVHVVGQAIGSALAQTVSCEVIVVDDGSTDNTLAALEQMYADKIVIVSRRHAGPASARNAGIEYATGDYVMFLDADDIIAPDKVEKQLAAFEDDIGWVLCDVLIEPVGGEPVLASKQYDYREKHVGGWIQPLLGAGNFIPIMSPLIRREVLDGIRFDESKKPEDWHFWHAVAAVARCKYLPEVLATYRKQPNSRNTTTKPHPARRPGVVEPLRMNLGCGTPHTRSWHPIAGMVNLDRSMGWRFEDGLGDFLDGSVSGITISHALMYVALEDWPRVFADFARVLTPGGVLRVTEDDTTTPGSTRIGGWRGSQPAVALTDAAMVRHHMEQVGFTVFDQTADSTRYADRSLIQAQHGVVPDVFFVEGVRESCLLLSPHSDDECLFGSFTIIRHRPRVVICFPSSGDYGSTEVRAEESREAVALLGGGQVEQWDGTDLAAKMTELDRRLRPTRVWAPSPMASHPDHVAVANAARKVFGDRLTAFHTYNDKGKVRVGEPVPFEPGWTALKRRALGCYRTQWKHPRACQFFDFDLAEYQE